MQINYLRLNYEYYVKTGGPIPKCLRRFTGVVNVFKRHDATLEAIFTRNKEAKEEKTVVETATTAYDEGSETETEDEFITDGTENVLLGPLPEYTSVVGYERSCGATSLSNHLFFFFCV
ncbi:hypothetical protein PC129_g22401 [Phytophthora cactorum]|uniref:Uncharacterized protein n=1 Tax=Phytophthora cactorum TaxID=29920 RepID=A0A329RIF4_9STRA|nr:hypothetical protein Pcac1_g19600 [Phytophthora cactorum]KAG2802357.1 hypothetical protein PC112_g19661 [Phytophthora cactorum]KAG2803240.1 hypothetical protein PC111_g18766 [Phytophthora cactorum]KAG2832130.1 hypothetical protein PC113_g20802 [Phytophthora cactorum]KAG2878513.1 hypothetical protein PC114_g23075 [Phytophthora cactorum]